MSQDEDINLEENIDESTENNIEQSTEQLPEPKWYVVHTYSGYENKVKTDLEKKIKNREMSDLFFNIVIPTVKIIFFKSSLLV